LELRLTQMELRNERERREIEASLRSLKEDRSRADLDA
jgi:hypothetical protein